MMLMIVNNNGSNGNSSSNAMLVVSTCFLKIKCIELVSKLCAKILELMRSYLRQQNY